MWTTKDKHECARRELFLRIRVYARRVQQRQMSETQASREIALMDAIAEDYRRLLENEAEPAPLLPLRHIPKSKTETDNQDADAKDEHMVVSARVPRWLQNNPPQDRSDDTGPVDDIA